MAVLLVTYVYPSAIPFIPNFIKEVNKQSYKDFKIIFFNDGVLHLDSYLDNITYDFEIIEIINKSIAGVRFTSLYYLKEMDCEYIIFQDVDDGMSKNRVECLIGNLATYPVVCNDLSVSINNEIIERNIWLERLGKNFIFDSSFLMDKNIVGLGNSGIRREVLSVEIIESECVIAVDWFIFYQFLYYLKDKSLFTSDCCTVYNQYENNIAGVSRLITESKLHKCINVKKSHYEDLVGLDPAIEFELRKLVQYEKELKNIEDKKLKCFPFWWEETNII